MSEGGDMYRIINGRKYAIVHVEARARRREAKSNRVAQR